MHLTKYLTDKPRNRKKNYNVTHPSPVVVSAEQDATPAKPVASPPYAWTGRNPHASKKSTFLGAKAPPPCAANGDSSLVTCNRTFKIFRSRGRHHSAAGEGAPRTAAPTSRSRARGNRATTALHRSNQSGGEGSCPPKAHRRRRHLLSTASSQTTTPYTIYTARSVDPPSSRRRSGCRRVRNRPDRRRRGGSNGGSQKSPRSLL